MASQADAWMLPVYLNSALNGRAYLPRPQQGEAKQYHATNFHLWTSTESAQAGAGGVKLSYPSFVESPAEVSYESGSCEYLEREGDFLCRPGPDGYSYFNITAATDPFSVMPFESSTYSDEWQVVVTEGDGSEELDIFLNGKLLSDPLDPGVSTLFLPKPGALAVVEQILKREQLKQDIEYESERRQLIRRVLERAIKLLNERHRYNPRLLGENEAGKEKIKAAHTNMEIRPFPHFAPSQNNSNSDASDELSNYSEPQATGTRIDFFIPPRNRNGHSGTEPMDADRGEQTQYSPSTDTYRGRRSASHARSTGQGQAATHQIASPSLATQYPERASPSSPRGGHASRGRGGKEPAGLGRGKAKARPLQVTGSLPQSEKQGQIAIIEPQTKDLIKPVTIEDAEAQSPSPMTTEAASPPTPSINLRLLSLKDRLTKMYDEDLRKTPPLTVEALNTVHSKILAIRDELASSEEDLRITALLVDYLGLLAKVAARHDVKASSDSARSRQAGQVEYLRRRQLGHPFQDWEKYFSAVIRWRDKDARVKKRPN
ncbi:MAG: hypothetical protein ACR2PT_07860 [Endozoicomonas sp.]